METLFAVIAAYVLGSIPAGLWVGKAFYNTDIRKMGSGNLGATNAFRTLGKKAGAAVTLIDILKGTAAVLLPLVIETDIHPLILGVAAVVGHIFPVFAGFRGGKAVATSGGVLLAYHWPLFVVMVLSFFLVLKLTKIVSLTSISLGFIAMAYTAVYVWLTGDWLLFIVIVILSVFIIYRHRSNIARIRAGTEPKVKWM
ncbi:glycerol-3-phosphate 1-O-acyltransferase PlsY [Planococcus lenghuensis]|uniref:Glycerol-3-phosphate acyltransferase n=1 Tax=Planococcus lenghuensis TaxID=2213202 RepID=A0A1Q2KZ50_9BACL|nr:glycerol-3-phosphate 1-O-acyltransferase PlsY [Planococcus lenghuensis]AQQ53077.1 glycerol-3-phosphate acyltransferase [Planococcus lenghuensis]